MPKYFNKSAKEGAFQANNTFSLEHLNRPPFFCSGGVGDSLANFHMRLVFSVVAAEHFRSLFSFFYQQVEEFSKIR